MPSHIFTQLGMWEDSIVANHRSADEAVAQGKRTEAKLSARLSEIHALDYLIYAYLQRGQEEEARGVLERMEAMEGIDWRIGGAVYHAIAIRARYALERRRWQEAITLPPPREGELTGWGAAGRTAVALGYWARAVGAARAGQPENAQQELAKLEARAKALQSEPGVWARSTGEVLRLEAASWLAFAKGAKEEALKLMQAAVELEVRTDKIPLSPGRVLPAPEQMGDLLISA